LHRALSISYNEIVNTNKQTGEKVVHTNWHNIGYSHKAAEICEKYLSKAIRYMSKVALKNSASARRRGQSNATLAEVQWQEFYFFDTKIKIQGNNQK